MLLGFLGPFFLGMCNYWINKHNPSEFSNQLREPQGVSFLFVHWKTNEHTRTHTHLYLHILSHRHTWTAWFTAFHKCQRRHWRLCLTKVAITRISPKCHLHARLQSFVPHNVRLIPVSFTTTAFHCLSASLRKESNNSAQPCLWFGHCDAAQG